MSGCCLCPGSRTGSRKSTKPSGPPTSFGGHPGSSPPSCRAPTSPTCKSPGGASARAQLEDVRIHDLSHSYASRALTLGESLTMIGKLLGHTQVQTTARYAHLARDSIQTAAARITGSIGGNLSSGRCRVNRHLASLWAPTPEIMQRSSLAATVSSRRRGIGGVFGGRPDGVGR